MKRKLHIFITSTTARLAATYLAIIMLMSIGFSIVLYNSSIHTLNRQVPPNNTVYRFTQDDDQTNQGPPNTVRDFLKERAEEGRRDLLMRLVIVNSLALIVGSGVSYYLARRTLRPIEQAMEAQSQFVSDASHELRTPLTSIQTSNDVALRNKKLTLADAKAVIRENTEEAIKLKLLTDGLLDLAKHDKTTYKLEPTSVQAAAVSAINQVIAQAQAKNITIDDTTANLKVYSEVHVLSQVLVILLDNAIKYSDDGSNIKLYTTVKGNQVNVHVEDSGIGIRASDLGHIFRRFYRADSARSRSQDERHGYGLGLAIAQTLVKTHGATLQVRSELGAGSIFSIMLRSA